MYYLSIKFEKAKSKHRMCCINYMYVWERFSSVTASMCRYFISSKTLRTINPGQKKYSYLLELLDPDKEWKNTDSNFLDSVFGLFMSFLIL